jgi:EAL domain-containing protein (putative c-di-GMP-specific phosphodiesterase class I)
MSVSNLGQTLANLARLRMRGLQLSLDDFCTGYATYQQLERIPFNELKVDISITRHLPHSRKQAILARSIIQLGKDLGLKVVAEGIETQGCWDLLKAMGCDYGQGYFLARPMPGGRLLDWSLQGRANL